MPYDRCRSPDMRKRPGAYAATIRLQHHASESAVRPRLVLQLLRIVARLQDGAGMGLQLTASPIAHRRRLARRSASASRTGSVSQDAVSSVRVALVAKEYFSHPLGLNAPVRNSTSVKLLACLASSQGQSDEKSVLFFSSGIGCGGPTVPITRVFSWFLAV